MDQPTPVIRANDAAAIANSAAAISNLGTAAQLAKQVADAGSMGLKGTWALVGNSTAMVVVAMLLFWAVFEVKTLHMEGMGTMRSILDRQEKQMDRADDQHRIEREALSRIVGDNSKAIDRLTEEVRLSRQARQDKE